MANTAFTAFVGSAEWEAEDSFADAADDTVTYRMTPREVVGVEGLVRQLIDRGGVFQTPYGKHAYAVPAFGVGSFTTVFDLGGHGSATTGSLTNTDLGLLLGHVFGNSDATQAGTTVNTVTSAAQWTKTAGTCLAGGLIRVGALNDGRGGGQFYAVNNATTITTFTGTPVQPNSADVMYAAIMAYPVSTNANMNITSSGAAANNTVRWVFRTANYQVICRGCAATGARIVFDQNAPMRIEIDWGTVAWSFSAGTYPSAVSASDKLSVVPANGGLFYNAVGTTTSSKDTPLEFAVEIGMNTMPVFGQGGENAGQNVQQWVRGPADTFITFAVEAEAATATPLWYNYAVTDPNSITAKHVLYTASIVDGSAIGMYFPNCFPVVAPTWTNVGGVNAVRMRMCCVVGTTTTNELTQSPWRLALG